jgi:hypothetical protein
MACGGGGGVAVQVVIDAEVGFRIRAANADGSYVVRPGSLVC